MEFSSSTDAQLHSWTPVPALESGPCGSFHTFLLPENPQVPRADQEGPSGENTGPECSALREGVFNFHALN